MPTASSAPLQHQKPSRLVAGDTIGVVSPAGRLSQEHLNRLNRGVDYLASRGFRPLLAPHAKEKLGYLAGADSMRAQDLNAFLRDPDIAAIFCTRGGYGVTRILDRIDYDAARNYGKIILGYSDISALHLALYARAQLITFSGPMVAVEMGGQMDSATESALWRLLLEGELEDDNELFNDIEPLAGGIAEGPLLGGCLSVLVSLLGTPHLPDFSGAILLLEDVGEDVYKIDRYFSQLKNSGLLAAVNGIVLGQFVDIDDDENDPPLTLQHILHEYVGDLGIPVLSRFPAGHGPSKVTLPIGCFVRIDAMNGSLQLLESPFA